jgi:hypothetical protein
VHRFRDPIWQSIGVFVAIVVGGIGVALILVGRPHKGLRVEVLSNSPLIPVTAEIANEIQVLYEGQPVQTLSVILLRLENTGNEPITENDYSEPIRISIGQHGEIGEVTVQETRPEGIPLTPTITSNTFAKKRGIRK